MNGQCVLPRLKAWFKDYIQQFCSDDPIIQENIDLKAGHTRRVCEAIVDIAGSLDLSEEDISIAEVCALLHDIGRFEQYRQYRTFSDYRSEDHAVLGVKIIKSNRVLNSLESAVADIVLRVVEYHNRASLSVGEEDRCIFFLKLLRDSDKIDIWKVLTDYYRNARNNRNHTIELDLPDTDHISEQVRKPLMNGELARMADLKTLNDFKLLQIGWVYDVNFPRTFQIVLERRYLEKIWDAISNKSTSISGIYDRARAYVERNK